MNISENNKFL